MELRYIPGVGPRDAKLMVVAEAPGQREEEEGEPLVGPTGRLTDLMLRNAGSSLAACYKTNVSKYRPPRNAFERLAEIGVNLEEQIRNLWIEINEIRPNCILVMGEQALRAVTGQYGIGKWRGSIILAKDGVTKVVPTIHPAAIYKEEGAYSYSFKYIIEQDVERAVEESTYKEYKPPNQHIEICTSPYQLTQFIRRNRKGNVFVSDCETIKCVPAIASIAFNEHETIVIPLWRKLFGVQLTEMGYNSIMEVLQIFYDLIQTSELTNQNVGFDAEKYEMIGLGPVRVHSDTTIKANIVMPELPSKSLEMLTSLWTRTPYYKDEGKEFKPSSKGANLRRWMEYCGRDALVTAEIDAKFETDLIELSDIYGVDLVSFYHDYVMKLFPIYYRAKRNGFLVDNEVRAALKLKYLTRKAENDAWFEEVLGHSLNVLSNPQITHLLYDELKLPRRKGTGAKVIAGLLANVIKDRPKWKRARAVLDKVTDQRATRRALTHYINAKLDYDGRMKTNFRLEGAETGRTTTSILAPPVRPEKIGIAFQTLTKHGTVGTDIREMLVPRGLFINIDLSQIEATIVALLSNDYDLLEIFEKKLLDIHKATAGWNMGLTDDEELILSSGTRFRYSSVAQKMSKSDPERFIGKKTRHAAAYDESKKTHCEAINAEAKKLGIDLKISEWRAGKILEIFHEKTPKIRSVYHAEVQDVLDRTRTLINPYGRVRRSMEKPGSGDMYRDGYAAIPQSTVKDYMGHAILRAVERMPDFAEFLIVESHDGLTFDFPKDEWEERTKIIHGEMTGEINFSKCSLPRGILKVKADVEIATKNYNHFEEVDL